VYTLKSKPDSPTAAIAVVVNDDPTQLSVLSSLVLKAGLSPRAFTDAEAALADMTANAGTLPVLIVTDLYMPGIDGWRFCRLLRSPEYPALKHVPILVVSATFVGAEPDRIAADLGAETFLSSPVDGKLFVEQVQAIVHKRQVQKPLRVLIVEDSKTLAGMLKKTFDANGYEADTALTFRAAAEAFGKNVYEVAVLDYHLPDGKGDDLLDDFRATQPNCVCIMMTNDPGPGLALDWMKRGAAAYLRKPFKPEYLIELCANARRERGLLRVQDLLEVRTRELRQSEERYRGVFAGTPDGIIVHDAEGLILDANEAMAQRLEISLHVLKGRLIAEFITQDSAANIRDNARSTLAGQSNVFETTYVSASGKKIPAEVHERRIQWRNKQVVLSISRDITERKQAEETLKQSEAQYRLLADHMRETVWLMDMNLKTTYCSPSIQKLSGYTPAELKELQLDQHISPASLKLAMEVVSEEMPKVLADQTYAVTRTMELERYRKDGTAYWSESTFSLIRDESGKPLYILSEARDITDRKQVEHELRESETKYRLLADNMKDQVWLMDLNLKPTYISPSVEKFRGYTLEESVQLPIDKHLTAASFQVAMEFLSMMMPQALADKTFRLKRTLELEFYRKDGTTLWVESQFSFIRDENDNPLYILGVGRDITDRKRAQDALRKSEEEYRWVMNNMADVITVIDMNLRITYVSPSILRMRGYTAEEATAQTFEQFMTPESLQIIIQTFEEEMKLEAAGTADPGRNRILELEQYKKDGSTIWMEVSMSFMRDEAQKPVGIISVSRDITDRKRAQEDKANLEAQLRQAQKMESIGRLAGGVAHDFNNMLSVIQGYSELAIRKAGADNPLQRHLAQILDASRRSAALTRQLLAFARQQTIAPIVLDLNETIESMLKMLQRLIGEDIELKWHPKADLWPVKMDPSQIDQILANLCVNARDAIADVGKITIETENVTLDNSYCANHQGFAPGDYLRITVSDDGYGMDKETRAKLFEPFFTTKEMGKGTGLGLATVYGIVKQNNGFINVYSEPGQGTSFTIYLLRHTDQALQPRQAVTPRTALGGHETILLVEDEPAILEMATTMLEGQGYTVRAAVTPGEAMRLASEHKGKIDLLVTDVVMPGMNGRDLAKKLLLSYPHLKRLFMSGYTANVIAHHSVLDEGVYFIQKPFSIEELSAKVRESLDGNENPLSE
jgi:two-component system cell cycle sensor histidine kinase/response regulator CckA